MRQRPTPEDIRRNPVLGLPMALLLIEELTPAQRLALAGVFTDLAADARKRAQAAWLKNKGPMAAYWKATGAYAGHIARVLK